MTKHFHVVMDNAPAFEQNLASKAVQDALGKPIQTIDDGLAFYLSQLTQLEARLYEVRYRNIVFQDFVPVDTSGPDYIDSFSYIYYDSVTMGKFVGANPKDIPRATIDRNIRHVPLFLGGIGYDYTLDELRKSQAMGQSLDTAGASAAQRGFQEHAQRVAFTGDSTRNVTGLLNNANVQTSTAANDGTGSSTLWSAKTPDQIVRDMNAALTDVWVNSAEVHVPNVLLLPSDRWASIQNIRMGTNTDLTVLEFFRTNNLYTAITNQPITVRSLRELQTAGAGGTHRMMAYELDDMNLTMRMPISLRFLPPQPEGLAISVDGEYKFGGVEFRYPGSAAYVDGI